MLSERVRQVLEAFVDEELDPRQRVAVLRLLDRSPEAREYLEILKQNGQRLKNLPRRRLGPDFSTKLVKAIADRQAQPGRLRRLQPTPTPAFPLWIGLSAAASVLLTIGMASYLFFSHNTPAGQGGPVANDGSNNSGNQISKNDSNGSEMLPPEATADPENNHGPNKPPVPDDGIAKEGPKDLGSPDQGNPAVTPGDPITGPLARMELFGPHSADISLPVVQKFVDLNSGELRTEFQKDSGFRIELLCRESARAFERLQVALKAHGVTLMVDGDVQSWLKQPKLHINFVLFTEDLSAEEVVKLLELVAADDRKAEGKKAGDSAFAGLYLTRMDADDRKEMASLLGIDAKQVLAPKPAGPLNFDPKTPLPEITAAQIAAALAGQGSMQPRGTDPAKPTAKPADPRAIVLPFNPIRPRPGSPEVKKFLDARKPLKAGNLQVVFVVRELPR